MDNAPCARQSNERDGIDVKAAVREANLDASIVPGDRQDETASPSLYATRKEVLDHLRTQGFKVSEGGLIMPVSDIKESVRALHDEAVLAQRDRAAPALGRHDAAFQLRLAAGDEIDPSNIRPRLIRVERNTPNALLWRWCSLHWSIPVSSGYGRRLRFLVVDAAHNNAVVGLIGLADPVYAMGVRDQTIGWSPEQRRARLTSVMDAFVLGAVPPYSYLLGGKLMAMLLASTEIRDVFSAVYSHKVTLIEGRDPNAQLALVTTTSALGRSSVYNRVRRRDGSNVLSSVGYTIGSGDFHFSGAIYEKLASLANEHNHTGETHRHARWGKGFRNRREVIQRALKVLDLDPYRLRVHGIKREVFLTPQATNTYEYLRGEVNELSWLAEPADDIATWWKERWAVPRAASTDAWKDFRPSSWQLYS